MRKTAFALVFLIVWVLPYQACGWQSVPLTNPDFENGMAGWAAYIDPNQAILESVEGAASSGKASCRVKNRQEFWTGIQQDLTGLVEADLDYEVRFWIKSDSGKPFVAKCEIQLIDDRGTTYHEIGKVLANENDWTEFRGGIRIQANGPIQQLSLAVAGAPEFVDDFLIDDVSMTLNDWVTSADARIEAHRKSSVRLSVVKSDQSIGSHFPVRVQQIRSDFAFGSTLNASSLGNRQYETFFRDHFEWATIEWHSQWVPTEPIQDQEDYSVADASVAFARDNNILIRGHALAWSKPEFVPDWLPNLTNVELLDEVQERMANATSHFAGKLAAWDVCNELLHYRFFRDRLGSDITKQMFCLAKNSDPDTPLFTNEYDIFPFADAPRVNQYVELLNQLLSAGAPVNGIGVQGHFWSGNVSPTNMGIAIDKLATFDLPIFVSEFDVVNSSDTEKAKQLETAYRYLFSRPEIDGILMWGFWADAHWRGADAALVESDWTINEAGQKYLALRDEWTTNVDGITDADGNLEFTAFHGTYLAEVTDPKANESTYHLFRVPRQSGRSQVTKLNMPETPDTLSIYGTESDDLIEIEMTSPIRVKIGSYYVPVPNIKNLDRILFVGRQGADELVIHSPPSNTVNRFFLRTDRLTNNSDQIDIQYSGFSTVSVKAPPGSSDQIRIYDSESDDIYVSDTERSVMITPEIVLIAENFPVSIGYAGVGLDSSTLYDNDGNDLMFSDLKYSRVKQAQSNRRANGFELNSMVSRSGYDRLTINDQAGPQTIDVSPAQLQIQYGNRFFDFEDMPYIKLKGVVGTPAVINLTDSIADDRLTIRENYVRLEDYLTYLFIGINFNRVVASASNSGGDMVSIRDTAGNELFCADSDTAMMSGKTIHHLVSGFDTVHAVGNQGGTNEAHVGNANFVLQFFGNWLFP